MLGSVAYLLTSPVPKELIGAKIRETLTPVEQLRLMDRAVNRWSGQHRGLVELARVMLLSEMCSPTVTREEFDSVVGRYQKPRDYLFKSCAERVAGYIAGEPWWLH